MEPLFPPNLCTWIGLNPSIADEIQLDPTLRRTRAFSAAWGYNGLIMTNLFGLVSTDPDQLSTVDDPVGSENDRYILQAAQETGKVVAAGGVLGGHQKRCNAVLEMLSGFVGVSQRDQGRLPDPPSLCSGRYSVSQIPKTRS